MEKEKLYCQYRHCETQTVALPPIGTARKNGKSYHNDWRRKYHKKCFLEIEGIRDLPTFMRNSLFPNFKP